MRYYRLYLLVQQMEDEGKTHYGIYKKLIRSLAEYENSLN